MPTPLSDYYRELQQREGFEAAELVAEWDAAAVEGISADFRAAMAASEITQQVVPIRAGSTNQSVGNQVADFFTLQFPRFLHEIHSSNFFIATERQAHAERTVRNFSQRAEIVS